MLRGGARRQQDAGQTGRRETVQGESGRRADLQPGWQDAPPRALCGIQAELEKGVREVERRGKGARLCPDLGADMPIKSYRPTTPTRRFQTAVSREDITKEHPEKSLLQTKKGTGGRNSTGRVTSRFIGGGHKQAYRLVDFK